MSRENSIISGNSEIRRTEIIRRMGRLEIDLNRKIQAGIKIDGYETLEKHSFCPDFCSDSNGGNKIECFQGAR